MAEIRDYGAVATVQRSLRNPVSPYPILTANPFAAGDVTISLDGAAATAMTNPGAWAVVNGQVQIPLTAAQMSAREVTILGHDQDGGTTPAFLDFEVVIQTQNHPLARYPGSAAAAGTASGAVAAGASSLTIANAVGNPVRAGFVAVGPQNQTGRVAGYASGVVTFEAEGLNGALADGDAVVFYTGDPPVRTGYQANVTQINSVTLTGDGSATPWAPAP